MIPQINLIDTNSKMTEAWKDAFVGTEARVYTTDFLSFMNHKIEVDAVVSPANSFGILDGGYDKAIAIWGGEKLCDALQKKLKKEYMGEQPPGTCMAVEIPDSKVLLLHTPTMRTPEVIIDPRVVYSCMRSTLVVAIKNERKNIVIPAFGGLTGAVPPKLIGVMMRLAYDDVLEWLENPQCKEWKDIKKILLY